MCVVEIEGVQFNLTAAVEKSEENTHTFTCSPHQVTRVTPVCHLTSAALSQVSVSSVCLCSFTTQSVSSSIWLPSICGKETIASTPHQASVVRVGHVHLHVCACVSHDLISVCSPSFSSVLRLLSRPV